MSDLFNAAVDYVLTSWMRLLELPLVLLLAGALLGLGGLWFALDVLARRRGGRGPGWRAWGTVSTVLVLALLLDVKLARLHGELRGLRMDVLRRISASSPGTPGWAARATTRAPLFDLERVRSGLRELLPGAQVSVEPQAEAVDYVSIRAPEPDEVQVHVAVVDLRDPRVEVRITEELTTKWMLSDFAAKHGCVVALNGEAGLSPKLDSGLGKWSGNWVVRGTPIRMDDTDERPFLSFDEANRGRYSPHARVDVKPTPEKYNTLWGREDILVGGASTPGDNDKLAPRCFMAIDAAGSTLFLMVVDGRRPGHSLGLGATTCGELLLLFGATDGMRCDQGGSACLFLASRGGLVSTPSDAEGERPTYTHFGIALRDA